MIKVIYYKYFLKLNLYQIHIIRMHVLQFNTINVNLIFKVIFSTNSTIFFIIIIITYILNYKMDNRYLDT